MASVLVWANAPSEVWEVDRSDLWLYNGAAWVEQRPSDPYVSRLPHGLRIEGLWAQGAKELFAVVEEHARVHYQGEEAARGGRSGGLHDSMEIRRSLLYLFRGGLIADGRLDTTLGAQNGAGKWWSWVQRACHVGLRRY